MTDKRCAKCGEGKDEDEFSWDDRAHTRRHSWCRECTSANTASWYQKNGPRKQPQKNAAQYRRRHSWKQRTGLRPEVVEALLETHDGRCDACGRTAAEAGMKDRKLCLDHDHLTRTFRGWLCHGCNLALGHVQDDVARLQALIEYLTSRRDN